MKDCEICGHEVDSYGCTFLGCDSNTGIASLQAQVRDLQEKYQEALSRIRVLNAMLAPEALVEAVKTIETTQGELADREAEVMGLVAENDFLKAEVEKLNTEKAKLQKDLDFEVWPNGVAE